MLYMLTVTAAGLLIIELGAWAFVRPPSAKEIAREINGGDNYAFLRADDGDLVANKPQMRLWIEATGPMLGVSFFISPSDARRDYNDPRYWALSDRKFAMPNVYQGAVLAGRALDPGEYTVEIAARNGSFVQALAIMHEGGGDSGPLVQRMALTRSETGENIPIQKRIKR
jgi:hypothetical protein